MPSTRSPDDVPRLPRGRGIRLGPGIFKIVMVAGLLVAVLVLRRPCSDSVGKFVGDFDNRPDAGVPAPPPDPKLGPVLELDTSKLSDEEIRKRIEEFRGHDAGAPPAHR